MGVAMQPMFEPGTLLARATGAAQQARAGGSLRPIATRAVIVESEGIAFRVRILAGEPAAAAEAEKRSTNTVSSAAQPNPFLPYEPAMFVADISATHLCLLNKFTVIDNHLLIVTRAFEEQMTALTVADFAALWACMGEGDGLGFYNAGRVAGASQRHKHLQWVPLGALPMPLEARLATPGRAPLPFRHALRALGIDAATGLEGAAHWLHSAYLAMLQEAGLDVADGAGLLGAYNLLVTRRWMLLVPRRYEAHEAIAVNALGFAGCLLVRNEEQLHRLRALGPLHVLTQVAYPHA